MLKNWFKIGWMQAHGTIGHLPDSEIWIKFHKGLILLCEVQPSNQLEKRIPTNTKIIWLVTEEWQNSLESSIQIGAKKKV